MASVKSAGSSETTEPHTALSGAQEPRTYTADELKQLDLDPTASFLQMDIKAYHDERERVEKLERRNEELLKQLEQNNNFGDGDDATRVEERSTKLLTSLFRSQQQFMDQQTMQPHELGKFSGVGEPNVEDWIERIRLIQSARSWTDAKMYNDVLLCLNEPAYSAVLSSPVINFSSFCGNATV